MVAVPRAAASQADWARRLSVRGLPWLASANRSMAAGSKKSRSKPARLTCELRYGSMAWRASGSCASRWLSAGKIGVE